MQQGRLPLDQARLRPHLRREQEQAAVFQAEYARASAEGVDVTAPRWKMPVGDDLERLRGLPAIGPGVAGAIRDTRPEQAVIAAEARRERRRR